ncbi:hypothetical protein PHYBOEH_001312 [Phytophthora boehmeriae]|uniref:HMG box domain-containing protein n=1 Tax=Phytophthora boehmeriae TaxID=109152 RepID=A0A8T1WWB1_9STRA|nr:hypothetical protein PHYBOEH_001312 [Phytophthora boehmeriae]
MSGGSQGDWHSPADRLALFMQRYAIAEDRVALQLNWTVEKLRGYLSPESRRLKAASDIMDTAVDKLLMKYRVALAHKTLMSASSKSLTPVEASLRRSSVPTQFGRSVIDRRSIIHADATPAQLQTAEDEAAGTVAGTTNRKRKRKVIVQSLAGSGLNTMKEDGSTATDTDSTAYQLDARKPRRVAMAELICPIRLDVDLDGVRFQDTFLLNAANPTCSPEAIAAQIARDEKMNEKLKDAIAESIRRQILTFTSCIHTELQPGRLYPIYLDLIINGFSRQLSKENRPPRPINPFIVYCQMQKEALGKTRRSASEMRKIMGDMWRKCTEEEKEYYTQLTEVENEKRRRDHVLDIRDRAIAEWEEEEARRKGLLASSTLEASAEHFRGLLLENYMSERNEVDANRAESRGNTGDDDEFDEDRES